MSNPNTRAQVEDVKASAIEAELNRARRENAQLRAALDASERAVEALSPIPILDEHEQPLYEIINAPFYSADGILYEIGARFTDLTGTIIPSESFLPLNEPARKRVMDWRMSLPEEDDTPPLDDILEAQLEVGPFDEKGNALAAADYKAAVVKQAIIRKQQRMGVKHDPRKEALAQATRNPQSAPMMTAMRRRADEKLPEGPRNTRRVDGPALSRPAY